MQFAPSGYLDGVGVARQPCAPAGVVGGGDDGHPGGEGVGVQGNLLAN